ncbi:External alternative NAD(P)H-ubiquinone oxidoreductase B4 mitochondrial [Bienertia sinuspersici]
MEALLKARPQKIFWYVPLQDAKAKVETLKLFAPSTSCKEDLEDEAFHDVMNGGKIPERPQGFGFGVKRSDVYGVRGLVRKEGYSKGKMKFVELDLNSNSSPCNKKKEDLEKRNEELSMKYNENNNLLKTVVTQFSEFLDVMRNGNASVQLIDAAQSTLAMATQQVDASHNDAPRDDGSRGEIANVVSKS